ncbi:MAG: hypothetical protein AVDCRST_MAG93-718 [uncultured Chloroflexia bacterium]|uniref:Uncharacterized protein n=1 Tax=uncultured Chloroflexia bacterium TaxID=1672391 RepID=A0A6J4HL38_9CHLR|nr:MAG: hypothetical protein AVDCRST_MAG93-718 [uncultured Chloroflexia bacterium]
MRSSTARRSTYEGTVPVAAPIIATNNPAASRRRWRRRYGTSGRRLCTLDSLHDPASDADATHLWHNTSH